MLRSIRKVAELTPRSKIRNMAMMAGSATLINFGGHVNLTMKDFEVLKKMPEVGHLIDSNINEVMDHFGLEFDIEELL